MTGGHPFWVLGSGWVRAIDLEVGDQLEAVKGETLLVASVVATEREETVFNIEVEGAHSYFVGRLGVWAHNACWDDIAEHSIKQGHVVGQSQEQLATYLKSFMEKATPTTTANGGKIWRRGAEIMIQRPGSSGTYFKADSSAAAQRYLSRFIEDNGGMAF